VSGPSPIPAHRARRRRRLTSPQNQQTIAWVTASWLRGPNRGGEDTMGTYSPRPERQLVCWPFGRPWRRSCLETRRPPAKDRPSGLHGDQIRCRPLGVMVSRAGARFTARADAGTFGTEPWPRRQVSLADYPCCGRQLGGRSVNASARWNASSAVGLLTSDRAVAGAPVKRQTRRVRLLLRQARG
jgi:hypothetical protein